MLLLFDKLIHMYCSVGCKCADKSFQRLFICRHGKTKLIGVVYNNSICEFQICASSSNEKFHCIQPHGKRKLNGVIKSPIVCSPLLKSPIDHNQIFDGYNVFIYKLQNVKKFVTYFDFHIMYINQQCSVQVHVYIIEKSYIAKTFSGAVLFFLILDQLLILDNVISVCMMVNWMSYV